MLDSVYSTKRSLPDFSYNDIMLVKATNSANDKVLAIDT